MIRKTIIALGSAMTILVSTPITAALAQQTAAAPAAQEQTAPEPLSDDELEVLVARIALYPDELVALISAAALFPLQIVEAERFLEAREKKPDMQPKTDWDGSVVSLLNYPQIVKMMSEDLEWTQSFGDAIANQQKDVLIAIQQLRDEAVAKNIIKTDDKVKVVQEGDNVVIQAANPETIYVPQYPPEMLYEPDYAPAPIGYYEEPYPAYWYPGAAFFAGAVTGAVFGAVVDWDDWGVWGGNWGGDVDIDCDKCFNNIDFDGKLKMSDIDWKNVDRSKLNIDRDQLQKFDRTNLKNSIKANGNNNLRNRAAAINRDRPNARPGGAGAGQIRDVRKSTLDGLKAQQRPAARPGGGGGGQAIANARAGGGKPSINRPSGGNKPSQLNRSGGKKKMAAKAENRPRKPSGLGNVNHGRREMASSRRGGHSMGGGHRGGGRPQVSRGGGRPQMHRGGGGGRGGGGRRR